MLKEISLILDISRVYSLPTTIFSWLIVFIYAVQDGGNIMYGIFAFVAICFVHFGTNITDDYFDYKSLIKQVNFDKKEYIKNSQKTKCWYLVSGLISEKFFIIIALFYFFIASVIGLFFYIKCGRPVLYFAVFGGIICILYSFLSKIKLSEISIALVYGPILYGGVYYVMTQTIPKDIFLLSIPTTIMTVILLYIHTVMDFEFDLNEGHKTVANSFDSQLDSIIILKILLILAYISPILLCIFDIMNWQIFLVYLTIPLSVDLYKSITDYSVDSNSVPDKKWFHFPMENMNRIKSMNAESFMIRIYQSRNLMMYYSLFLLLGIVLSNL